MQPAIDRLGGLGQPQRTDARIGLVDSRGTFFDGPLRPGNRAVAVVRYNSTSGSNIVSQWLPKTAITNMPARR